jgi:hypothetical protein
MIFQLANDSLFADGYMLISKDEGNITVYRNKYDNEHVRTH